LRAWLRAVVKNTLSNAIRDSHACKRNIAREVSLNAPGAEDGSRLMSPPAAEVAGRREQDERVRRAVAGLRTEAAEVLQLRYQEGLSWEEIGRRTGRSAEAARKLVERAASALREKLEGFL
jgi:RNA polymerase sigma factor (sigma-70 family)